jgi:hypothetical protein
MNNEENKTPLDMLLEKINSFESSAIRKSTVIELINEYKKVENQYYKTIFLQGQLQGQSNQLK